MVRRNRAAALHLAQCYAGDTLQARAYYLTVEEIVPLVEALAPRERKRLLRRISELPSGDAAVYALNPPAHEEFTVKEDPLAWDSEGWENIP